ncbi:MAG: hypothetical protein AAB702_00215 [Patescibacteria group bacterium]
MTESGKRTGEPSSNQWASREFQHFGDEDPKIVSARAEMAHRQSPMGHLEVVANPTRIDPIPMERNEVYRV